MTAQQRTARHRRDETIKFVSSRKQNVEKSADCAKPMEWKFGILVIV